MNIVFTAGALSDLAEVIVYTKENHPSVAVHVEERISLVIDRIRTWPQSGRAVEGRPGVRVVLVVRYPFKIFYRVANEQVEILHIHHTSRAGP